MQIQMRFKEGTSDKFWRVSVDGVELVTAWGRTGTDGRSKTETFPTAEHAESAAAQAADSKRRKGYVDVDQDGSGTAATPTGALTVESSQPSETSSDRQVISSFFRSIDRDDLIALPPDSSRMSQEDGHADAAEIAARRGLEGRPYHVVMWHQQSAERAWDPSGNFVSPLLLHWAGDHERVASALAGVPSPYTVQDKAPEQAFVLEHPDVDARQRERPIPVLYKLATAKSRYSTLAANPPAIAGWLRRRKAAEDRPVAQMALEALVDVNFDEAARRELIEQAAYDLDRVKRVGRLISGLLAILELDGLSQDVHKEVLERLEAQHWHGVEPKEKPELRRRFESVLAAGQVGAP